MGRRSSGYLKQNFEIRLDLEKLYDYIAEQIVKAIESEKTQGKQTFTDVDISDIDIDGDYLELRGSYDTAYEHWHCNATLESPEENDYEYESIEGWGDKSLLSELPDNLKELITVHEVNANEEMTEIKEPTPPSWYEDY